MIAKASPPAVFDRLSALSDPIRARLLACLERHELSVGELQDVLQLPQSTVSRHLKALAGAGWIAGREQGTANRYRMPSRELEAGARKLWQSVRDELAELPAARRDADRLHEVLASRHTRSQEFFASAAGQWDRLRTELFGARPDLFAFLGLLDPHAVLADLGCGTGQLAEAAAPFVKRVIAVDESTAMLRAARQRLSEYEHAEVRAGRLESLPIEDATVDVAVLSLVLPYVPEPRLVLAEGRRILRDGGRLLIVDMQPHEKEEYRQTMGHVWLGFDALQMEQWGLEAGFSMVRTHPLPSTPGVKGTTLQVSVCL